MTVVRRSQTSLTAELGHYRKVALTEVSLLVGEIRQRYITIIPGQEMIYQAKEAEARLWLQTQPEDLTDFPLLAAEVGITAPTAFELAQLWLNLAVMWKSVAAQLETLRLQTGAAIAAAGSAAEIEAVMNQFRSTVRALS